MLFVVYLLAQKPPPFVPPPAATGCTDLELFSVLQAFLFCFLLWEVATFVRSSI